MILSGASINEKILGAKKRAYHCTKSEVYYYYYHVNADAAANATFIYNRDSPSNEMVCPLRLSIQKDPGWIEKVAMSWLSLGRAHNDIQAMMPFFLITFMCPSSRLILISVAVNRHSQRRFMRSLWRKFTVKSCIINLLSIRFTSLIFSIVTWDIGFWHLDHPTTSFVQDVRSGTHKPTATDNEQRQGELRWFYLILQSVISYTLHRFTGYSSKRDFSGRDLD